MPLQNVTVFLGISGSVSAYKSAEIIRLLKKEGASVRVAMTRAACSFMTPMLAQTLSGESVMLDVLEASPKSIPHVDVAYEADIALVAPATANTLSKLAQGGASCAISSTLLSHRGPLLIAPAMESRMWSHPATLHNVSLLKERGARFIGPEEGSLASGRSGAGRLSSPERIVEVLVETHSALTRARDLEDVRVLITAGPTVEDLDPVRYLSNRSTGRMGVALAKAAKARGAKVTMVHGPLKVSPAEGVDNVAVRSAQEMFEAVMERKAQADISILAAAVADYRPAQKAQEKLKKGEGELSIELERTPDILRTLGAEKTRGVLIGFAAESENLVDNARGKRVRKQCDFICANSIAGKEGAFGSADNAMTLVFETHEEVLSRAPKIEIAHKILDAALPFLKGQGKT